jgi:hypothetical protein
MNVKIFLGSQQASAVMLKKVKSVAPVTCSMVHGLRCQVTMFPFSGKPGPKVSLTSWNILSYVFHMELLT